MILILFCSGSIVLGALLHVCFRRFSWIYLLVSIVLSAAGFLGTEFALGEIRPFPPSLEYIGALAVWNLIPWLIFAFLPLQAGYLAAMLIRLRFCYSTKPADDSH
jgi:hypothetical protein